MKAKLTHQRIPIFLSLFITNRCNLHCKYCFITDPNISIEIRRAEYTKEEVFQIIDEFYDMGTRMIFLLGGEPLVHKDIGEIINYIVSKGIYLTICTNGVLIKEKLEAIKRVHVLAVSLDGVGDANDALRGQGTSQRVIEGIESALKAGIPCRIHAVLTRNNLQDMRSLAKLTARLGVVLTISPPNFLGETAISELKITSEEYKAFWREYLDMFQEGLPIGNNAEAIRQCLSWPTDYQTFIRKGEKYKGYKPTFCLNGYTYVALGAEGTMYNCINLGVYHGPNIKKIGIRKAWSTLLEWRPDCVSCSSINCIETAKMLSMRSEAILSGLRFHAFRRENKIFK